MSQALFPATAFPVLQGWNTPGSLDLGAAFLRAGGWALPRTDAFPDPARVKARLQELAAELRGQARLGLDLRGLREGADGVVEAAREAGVAFLLHPADRPPALAPLRRGAPRVPPLRPGARHQGSRSGPPGPLRHRTRALLRTHRPLRHTTAGSAHQPVTRRRGPGPGRRR